MPHGCASLRFVAALHPATNLRYVAYAPARKINATIARHTVMIGFFVDSIIALTPLLSVPCNRELDRFLLRFGHQHFAATIGEPVQASQHRATDEHHHWRFIKRGLAHFGQWLSSFLHDEPELLELHV